MHQLTGSKILVVEDDPNMGKSIRTLLNLHGFDAQTSLSLPEARRALENAIYDLVLLDLKLADDCGFDLMDHVVQRALDTRVIVVTGQHSETFAITALKKGATDYLKKPFEPHELIEAVTSVLDRQRQQRELELFKHAVKASSAAIALGVPDGKIVYTNGAFRKMVCAGEDDGNPSLAHFSNSADAGTIDEQIGQTLKTGVPWRGKTELVGTGGKPLVVCKQVDPIPEPIGGKSYGVAMMCDMTAQLEKARALANSRERYRKVVDSQKEFLYRLNSDLLITFVNQTYATFWGETPRSMMGMPITSFVQDSLQPTLLNALDAVRYASAPVEIEFPVADENGRTHWQQWRFEGIRNASGDLTELQGVGRDVSLRKHAEKQMQEEAQKLKQALAKVSRLNGMLSICASCKKIRDDDGFWHKLEDYIENNTDAEFSHGLCPDCARQLYPELYE